MSTAHRWRKSSHSQNGGDCIELAHTLDTVRDSKNPAGLALTVTGIPKFLADLKRGRFDR